MSLQPKTRLKVGIDSAQIKYIAGQNEKLTIEQVKKIIHDVLQEILDLTLLDLEIWIDTFVPKRTGQLRENLKQQIKSSRVARNILRFILGTNVDYAEKVNQMSTSQVRHVGSWRERSGKWAYAYYYGHYGKIYLNDPRAIGSFFDHMLEFLKERVMINIVKAKNKFVGQTPINVRQMSKLSVM